MTESVKYLKRVFTKNNISFQKLALAREALKFHEAKVQQAREEVQKFRSLISDALEGKSEADPEFQAATQEYIVNNTLQQ